MYASRIAADPVTVATMEGLPPEIDVLATCDLAQRGFLRAAWYRGQGGTAARTLLVRRSAAGGLLAAIPTVPFGPAIAGARKVPGSYWPWRSVPIAADCNPLELAEAFEHPAARALGPALRIGPARCDDPPTRLLIAAARMADWQVLSRPAGTAWVIDCDAARAEGGPRKSTVKRMGRIERRLANLGTADWRYVRGRDWNDAVLDELAAVEAASWIAAKTDGSGAKFMTPQQRAAWRMVLADPVLAEKLCATVLTIDGRSVAFSFDLDDGPVRYGIAGSFVTEFGKYEVGKLANHRSLIDAIAAGQSVLDLGTGDSGYKREMGAVAGYQLAELLFVRNRAAARIMERVWGPPAQDGTDAHD